MRAVVFIPDKSKTNVLNGKQGRSPNYDMHIQTIEPKTHTRAQDSRHKHVPRYPHNDHSQSNPELQNSPEHPTPTNRTLQFHQQNTSVPPTEHFSSTNRTLQLNQQNTSVPPTEHFRTMDNFLVFMFTL
nr:hypothetical protein BgiMline_025759 [Biomphalaria glabrata]